MCTADDKAKFVDYDNYFNYQASRCAADCKAALVSKVQSNIEFCTTNCRIFEQYTKLCTKCFTNFLMCQSTNCNVCFASGAPFVAQACKSCATSQCRADLALCGGFPETMLNIPTSAPIDYEAIDQAKKDADQLGVIIGASIGGALALLAFGLILRRRSLNRQAAKEVDEVAAKIFKNKGMQPAASFTLNPHVDMQSASDNPGYASNNNNEAIAMRVPLRTRYSFHGGDYDELDIPAGVALLGLSRNNDWWVALDESSGKVGLVPLSYVTEL